MIIREFDDKEIKICVDCNVAFNAVTGSLPVYYKSCSHCAGDLYRMSQLIKKQEIKRFGSKVSGD